VPLNRAGWWVAAICLTAALLRAGYLAEASFRADFARPAADALYHDYWAHGLISGDWTPPTGLADPRIPSTPFLRPPGYPCFLALVRMVSGPGPWGPCVAQAFLGLATIVLAFFFARRRFGEEAATVAALLIATDWVLIFHEAELFEPPLLVFLLLLLLALSDRWAERTSRAAAAVTGLAAGALAVTRPNALIFLPILLAWGAWVLRGKESFGNGFPQALAFLAGCLALVLPVTARNLAVARDLVLISSNGGINLYLGNNPAADGRVAGNIPGLGPFLTSFDYRPLADELARREGRVLRDSEVSGIFARMARDYALSHPARTLELIGRKALLFWGPLEVSHNKEDELVRRDSRILGNLPGWPFLLGLALPGLVLAVPPRRGVPLPIPPPARRTAMLAFLLILSWFASHIPFIVAGRYRTPLVPLLALFAALGLARLAGLLRAGKMAGAARWGGALVLCSGLALLNPAGYRPDAAKWHYQRGLAEAQAGDDTAAESEFRSALAVSPGMAEAYGDLGLVHARRGETGRARETWMRGMAADPSYPLNHAYLGRLALLEGRRREAAGLLEKALALGASAGWVKESLREAER
jgi:tetratricopeptide (TPR) repeat protein